jgi:hypothetical protein
MSKMRKRRFTILTQGGAPALLYKINTIMKANKIIHQNMDRIIVKFNNGVTKSIRVPSHIDMLEEVNIHRGKIRMGGYQYNPKTATWEKISRILLFLQSIVEAIRNIFSK